jgi:hypothetical protein
VANLVSQGAAITARPGPRLLATRLSTLSCGAWRRWPSIYPPLSAVGSGSCHVARAYVRIDGVYAVHASEKPRRSSVPAMAEAQPGK